MSARDIKAKEKSVNIVFLGTGTLVAGTETSEKLHFAMALILYSRARFIVNLLPLLQATTSLKRVVSVLAGGKEGSIDTTDYQGWKVPMHLQRGHAASLVTLSHEALAQKAPDVSLIHDFPGQVKPGITRGTTGAFWFVIRALFKIIGPLVNIPEEESGARHLFLATSARYPAGANRENTAGVPLADEVKVSRGAGGDTGSGCYVIDQYGESAESKVEELLAKMRKDGMVEKVWGHTEAEFLRITGLATVYQLTVLNELHSQFFHYCLMICTTYYSNFPNTAIPNATDLQNQRSPTFSIRPPLRVNDEYYLSLLKSRSIVTKFQSLQSYDT
ncbi:MAG: hypothetical protein MMC33_000607 [Icmadophila ericetorum]|nr:hypothetical protein [Icmadophila ericetorum]